MLPAVPSSEVYLEDCVKALKRFNDKHFDLAIVDPPYKEETTGLSAGYNRSHFNYETLNKPPTDEYIKELFRVSKNQIVWGGNYMTEYLKPTSAWLFWDKGTGENDFADGELAWTSYNGALRKITKSWVGANAKDGLERIHPTQKPIYLYDWIFNRFAKEGNLILDTHVGSGSSRIAAHKNKLHFVGFEIDKGYFEAQEKRFNAVISQQTLF